MKITVNFTGMLFIVFLILKLTDVISWSWWWVTAPLWIPVLLYVLILIIIFCICGFNAYKITKFFK